MIITAKCVMSDTSAMLSVSEMTEGDVTERRDERMDDKMEGDNFRCCGGISDGRGGKNDRLALDGFCMGHCETSPPDTATLSPVPNAGGGETP